MNKVFPVAVDLLEKAKEINRFALMGKRPRILVAAAIYLAGQLTGKPVRQEALAFFFGTTAYTIRLRYVELAQLLGYEHSAPEGYRLRTLHLHGSSAWRGTLRPATPVSTGLGPTPARSPVPEET
jgi:hypothetical protein